MKRACKTFTQKIMIKLRVTNDTFENYKFNHMNFYIKILIFALTVSIFCNCSKRDSTKNNQNPNIIFILADDLGYGDLSCLNEESKISTPNLDKLASEGITFTDSHSGAAVCTPTRYGILTGRYSWRTELKNGVLWPWDEPLVEADRLTVGKLLKQHGYTTACIGKWHLGWEWNTKDSSSINDDVAMGDLSNARNKRDQFGSLVDFSKPIENGPVTRGFDYYFGDDVPNFPPYCFIENDHTIGIPNLSKPKGMFGHAGPMIEGWKLDTVMPTLTRRAVDYIKNKEAIFKRKDDAPFFLYFTLTAPHTPIAPTKEFKGKSQAGAYGDYVQQIDWTVGQIVKALEEKGLTENTLLIFTSDNGSPGRDGTNMSGATRSVTKYGHDPSWHFRGMKADVWEGGHHVPFIARWPQHIKPGSKSDETICHTDLIATAAAIVGQELPATDGEDSYNILPALKGEKYDKPIREATVHHSGAGQFAIRQGKWKLIIGGGSGGWTAPRRDDDAIKSGLPLIQLYDLSNDIGEQNNLQDKHPEIVKELTDLLEKYKTEGRSTPSR